MEYVIFGIVVVAVVAGILYFRNKNNSTASGGRAANGSDKEQN